MNKTVITIITAGLICSPVLAKKKAVEEETPESEPKMSASTFSAFQLRELGPAINSGRITDFAVVPGQRHRYYVATASGGVWKTVNAGTTWTPIFDREGSYSIGVIELDPNNPDVIWVGSGENNSQRSVGFGDGVYKSTDGGATWKNMGLENSEHIGMITIDPENSNLVYVAAQGPLWSSGGDRGLYRTADGGETWERILHVSDDTGINEVHLDPHDSKVLYASAYQRRRHVWTLINGGPESGFYKSTDGGETWTENNRGFPDVDMGRIGICVSPGNADILYAIVEAQRGKSGFFRSTNRGESWQRRSDYISSSPQYYNEIVCDPHEVDTVYSMDTWLHATHDGGASFFEVGEAHKHVDNHAMWVDPDDPDYWLIGCDGGIYESFDHGSTWRFHENFPITQFYRVSVDNSEPFYYIYGGTQDNNTLGGPTRTLNSSGISNEDWFITVGGDGYETVIDPTDPNILYSQWQYGGLVRYDRRSGEIVDIQPQEAPGEPADRWNWDSPLILSPHSHTRLYYASQRVYRSNDRGNSWKPISEDLSRQLDRNQLPVMGKIWSIDAVAKNMSTSNYGNIVSLTESPLTEGLLYVGTDDGLIHVTDGDGWRSAAPVPGVPEHTYVSRLEASLHDADTVYATFANYKQGDFTPYVAVSRDRGHSWTSIRGDLPDREVVHSLMQDHVKPELLFVGTEFGVYFTVDEGRHWIALEGGLPTIQVRDIDIQRRENDLALGTFGRGFWVLDDYSPLRTISEEMLTDSAAELFEVRTALSYVEKRTRHGERGDNFFTKANPPFGATFTYYLRDGFESAKEQRIEAEKVALEEERDPELPSMDELSAEDLETKPSVILTIRDDQDQVVRRVRGQRTAGIHRTTWDLRYPAAAPTDLTPQTEFAPWEAPPRGPLALAGSYTVTLEQNIDGELTPIAGPQPFEVEALELASLPAADHRAALDFERKAQRLERAVSGALAAASEIEDRLAHLDQALLDTPDAETQLISDAHQLEQRLDQLMITLRGDRSKSRRNVFQPPSISARVSRIVGDTIYTTSAPTATHQQAYEWAATAFAEALQNLRALVADLETLEANAEAAGAPWTPGRLPTWEKE